MSKIFHCHHPIATVDGQALSDFDRFGVKQMLSGASSLFLTVALDDIQTRMSNCYTNFFCRKELEVFFQHFLKEEGSYLNLA